MQPQRQVLSRCCVADGCLQCNACVKGCPTGAKFFDDAGYLYHQHELEAQYAHPAENEVFYIQL